MTLRYGPWSGWNAWFFFFVINFLILKSNNVNDMNIFGFSHESMQLKLSANRIKDQVILIVLGLKFHIPNARMWF